mmetsp:Transcript_39866/g.48571  ORF Transcript_39866/g.48571 Transcript_39866/m.48571 type:complete len:97 (-) Transcript_39866:356-646(-)
MIQVKNPHVPVIPTLNPSDEKSHIPVEGTNIDKIYVHSIPSDVFLENHGTDIHASANNPIPIIPTAVKPVEEQPHIGLTRDEVLALLQREEMVLII